MPMQSPDVCFSNRPFGVKHFQTIHQCGVDVARGLVLVFGIGTGAFPSWDSRTRRISIHCRWRYRLWRIVVGESGPLQTFGGISGLDITAFPDALWNPKISAKVTFAHFRSYKYKGRTLFELLKDKSLNWAAVRGFQSDMDHAADDQALVEERSQMFFECIGEAPASPKQSLAKRFLSLF